MDRERAIVQILRKRRKSFTFMVVFIILSIIILNLLITLTNNLNNFKNLASVLLIVIFVIAIYLIVAKVISVYIYILNEDYLAFGKKFGKKEKINIEIPIKSIVKYENIDKMETDSEISKTYEFIYREPRETTKFGDFVKDNKKYRFIFNPNDRINRMLERKLSER